MKWPKLLGIFLEIWRALWAWRTARIADDEVQAEKSLRKLEDERALVEKRKHGAVVTVAQSVAREREIKEEIAEWKKQFALRKS